MAPFFDDVPEDTGVFPPLPITAEEGAPPNAKYLMRLDTKSAVSKAGNAMVNITQTVVEPEEWAGRKVFDHMLFSKEKFKNGGSHAGRSLHTLRQLFSEDIVSQLEGTEVEVVTAVSHLLDGLTVTVRLGQREEEYQGRKTTKNSIREYLPTGAYGISDEDFAGSSS